MFTHFIITHIISLYIPIEVACCAPCKTKMRNWINGLMRSDKHVANFHSLMEDSKTFCDDKPGINIATIREIILCSKVGEIHSIYSIEN